MSKHNPRKSFIQYELPEKTLKQVQGGQGMTTMSLGEEGGGPITTKAIGEESGGPITTLAVGEEGC